jgi:hypothetical protein
METNGSASRRRTAALAESSSMLMACRVSGGVVWARGVATGATLAGVRAEEA